MFLYFRPDLLFQNLYFAHLARLQYGWNESIHAQVQFQLDDLFRHLHQAPLKFVRIEIYLSPPGLS
jgi:hypothetical protein